MAEKTGKPPAHRRRPVSRHRDLPAEHQQPHCQSDPSLGRKSFRNSGAIGEPTVEFWRLMKSDMRRTILIGILFLIAAARPAAAQSVLPSAFAEWKAPDTSVVVPATGLDQT